MTCERVDIASSELKHEVSTIKARNRDCRVFMSRHGWPSRRILQNIVVVKFSGIATEIQLEDVFVIIIVVVGVKDELVFVDCERVVLAIR